MMNEKQNTSCYSYKLPKGNVRELTWKIKDKAIPISQLNYSQLEIANRLVNNINNTHIGKIPKNVYKEKIEQQINLNQLIYMIDYNFKRRVVNSFRFKLSEQVLSILSRKSNNNQLVINNVLK